MRTKAFTLFEVILVILLLGLLSAAVVMAVLVLQQRMMPQRITLGSETLAIAPAFAPLPAAIQLHDALQQRSQRARAIYVFGGQHVSLSEGAAPTTQLPLSTAILPSIANFTGGLPLDAKGFYDTYAAELGPVNVGAHAEDFTVLTVGEHTGNLAVTCLVQVKRIDTAVSDGTEEYPFIQREVRMWDVNGSTYRYAFAERPLLASTIKIGAVHTWLRYRAGQVAEEGPTCTTFPDPWVYAGARGYDDDIPPFSRFTFFLPVSP